MKKWIVPALLLLGLASCKTKGLEYLSFEKFKVDKLGFPNSTISLQVVCYNPNKFGLNLTNLESDVFINQEYLGKAILDSTIAVPRKDTFMIPVKMDVKMGGTMTSILQLINNQADSTTLLIKLAGKAKMKKGGVGLTYPIAYEEMKVLKF
jgi:LEA14-like dessication related protein